MVWWSEVDSERSRTALAEEAERFERKGGKREPERNGVKEKRKWGSNRWSEWRSNADGKFVDWEVIYGPWEQNQQVELQLYSLWLGGGG